MYWMTVWFFCPSRTCGMFMLLLRVLDVFVVKSIDVDPKVFPHEADTECMCKSIAVVGWDVLNA